MKDQKPARREQPRGNHRGEALEDAEGKQEVATCHQQVPGEFKWDDLAPKITVLCIGLVAAR